MAASKKKRCAKCGAWKKLDEFHQSGDRLKSRCKACTREDNVKYWYKRVYHDALTRTNKNGLPFDITPEYILSLYRKQNELCHWFQIPMKPTVNQKDPQMPTIDRIVQEKGYTKGNIVIACFAANIGRNETSEERFKEFVELLRANS